MTDRVVFVPEDIAEPADIPPRDLGIPCVNVITQFDRRLANPLKATLNRILVFRVGEIVVMTMPCT